MGPAAPTNVPTSRRLRTVLIDDEAHVHTLVRLRLERAGGFELVGTAHDAPTGLKLAAEQRPDVVLLDLQLAGHNGAEFVGPLARRCPTTMVAVFSALPADEHEERLRQLGAFAYYPKDRIMSLPELIRRDHSLFTRALTGDDVLAPAGYPDR